MVVRPFVVGVSLLSLGFLGSAASAATGPADPPAVLPSDVDGLAAEASCFGIPATITGTPGADVLRGTPGPDVIAAGRGDDVVYGARDGDVICGGPGDDEIRGGRGFDSLDGGAGNDRVLGGRARAVNFPLIGGSGDDFISGRPEALNVFSYVGAPHGVRINLRAGTARGWGQDTLRNLTAGDGSPFDDVIRGDDGPNQGLFGGAGDDKINGGGG